MGVRLSAGDAPTVLGVGTWLSPGDVPTACDAGTGNLLGVAVRWGAAGAATDVSIGGGNIRGTTHELTATTRGGDGLRDGALMDCEDRLDTTSREACRSLELSAA